MSATPVGRVGCDHDVIGLDVVRAERLQAQPRPSSIIADRTEHPDAGPRTSLSADHAYARYAIARAVATA